MSEKPRPSDERLATVKLVIFDFDGILTDNRVSVSESGERTKCFWVPDGVGIFMGHKAGLKFAIITGNDDGATRHRAEFLRIDDLNQGVRDKKSTYEEVKSRHLVSDAECLFIGDDLPDLGVFRRAGITLAPADAHPRILEAAQWVGRSRGGGGIVREAIDALLEARGYEWPD
ncbi:MAG TPA: HAD hydrolase family protein [candidate division Zixibacteria bacterium]|jgi:3-deoxy-D-manno-octulosonate 8-phosphate phosphatase (KDO 8-P phosphatase)